MSAFEPALAVANAVLYEGYLLFPYTASSAKNRVRWQFGVIVPRAHLSAETGETAEQQTEILIEARAGAHVRVTVRLRFLHVEARRIDAWADGWFTPVAELAIGSATHVTFDEGLEREFEHEFIATPGEAHRAPIEIAGGSDEERVHDDAGTLRGRIVRTRWPLHGVLSVDVAPVAASNELRKLRVRVENVSDVVAGERAGALRTSFVSAHVLLAVEGGAFVSVLDPTPAAAAETGALKNRHVFPVLVGDAAADEQRSPLVLSSPIVLYDFPAVAPQTTADAFDATEIDELLMLSVLSLPDAERAEACATDPRARAIVERAERFGAHELGELHARLLHRDPFASIDLPALDCVIVDGMKVARGSAVRLHPKRRADVWDMFLDGKSATVRAVHQDVEDVLYVAVTIDDDPASDLHEWYGRSFFFYPDEIEPLADVS
jgi:hypothetical protein